ncbi:MAG: Xaa-Pro dipeptidase [Planctomycetota bacterium]|jgi:Xaa-Pro dipeptidase
MSSENSCPGPSRRTVISASAGLAASAMLGSCAAATEDIEYETRIDEELAALTDQSGEIAPISPAEHAARRKRLGELLSATSYEAILIEPCATMEYLSGVHWGHSERLFAMIVLADGSHFWLCPAFEEEKAKLRIQGEGGPGGEVVTWDEHEYAFAPLASELQRRRATRLCMEPSIRYGFVFELAKAMKQDLAPAARAIITDLRGRKDEHELALLRKANELTLQAINASAELFRPGMTGREIGRIVKRAHTRLGLTKHWDLSLIGAAAAYPHGENRDIELAKGDVILIDTGGDLHGYQSDNTRSWAFGAKPTERQSQIWHAVRDSQQAAFDAIRPGVRAGDVDLAARRFLEQLGLNKGYSTFSHRLGHGIGMEGHEDPYFDSGSDVVLTEGMTLSNEPGVYLYGEFGIRIEDIIAVNAGGAEHFGTWQLAPDSPH